MPSVVISKTEYYRDYYIKNKARYKELYLYNKARKVEEETNKKYYRDYYREFLIISQK